MRLRNGMRLLRCTQRKTGPSCWAFLWSENDADGNRTRRTTVIVLLLKIIQLAARRELRLCSSWLIVLLPVAPLGQA
jgi:hypothetical protein